MDNTLSLAIEPLEDLDAPSAVGEFAAGFGIGIGIGILSVGIVLVT
jgi:hypothetical protein